MDHSYGRVAQRALERRRVQQRCPRGFDPRTGQRAPTQEPALLKGEKCFCPGVLSSRTGTPQRRKVLLPGCSVFSLSWPSSAGAFLVPGRWFSGPAPSGSCLFLFRLMFLSTGRGRHVPAPSGRDVGSNSGAPTQEPAFSGIPLHIVHFNLGVCLQRSLCPGWRSVRGSVRVRPWWRTFSLKGLFDKFILLFLIFFVLDMECFCYLLLLTHSSHLRRLHSVSRHPSFGSP